MPSRRVVSYTVEELPPVVTTTTTTRRVRNLVPDDDGLSRETIVRRQDQRIKDDITNKLYRIEMDRVKPSLDVQLQAAAFRSRPRTRTVTPEPILRVAPRAHSVDVRRYSTAGNLDIYRPKTQLIRYGAERPDVVEYVSSSNALVPYSTSTALVPYGWKGNGLVETIPRNDYLSEYDLRRLAEIKVRGRNDVPNGRLKSTEVSYLPLVPRVREVSSPPALYRYSTETTTVPLTGHQPVSRAHKVASDGHYELDQFEKLMHRNFGVGGLNKSKTLLYTSPPYASAYEPYVSPYTSTYTSKPYYSGSYSYAYPYTYTRPYYYSSYVPSYSYYSTRPAEYEYIYSPPTRVTAPLGYYPYRYGTDYTTSYSTPRYYTYSYVR